MMSVEMTTFATFSLISLTMSRYRSMRYSRAMRLSTRSEPDCMGRWM